MAAAAERQAPVESAEAKATYDPERPMIMYSDGTARPAPIRHPTSAEYERSQGSYDRLMDFNAQSNRDREDMRLEQKRLEQNPASTIHLLCCVECPSFKCKRPPDVVGDLRWL